ncbi:MAG TPA: hypothetical protein VGH47_07385 [Xanthobacteraceae bacterium]|jgi:flagellar biosynthesis GTPase FlhF
MTRLPVYLHDDYLTPVCEYFSDELEHDELDVIEDIKAHGCITGDRLGTISDQPVMSCKRAINELRNDRARKAEAEREEREAQARRCREREEEIERQKQQQAEWEAHRRHQREHASWSVEQDMLASIARDKRWREQREQEEINRRNRQREEYAAHMDRLRAAVLHLLGIRGHHWSIETMSEMLHADSFIIRQIVENLVRENLVRRVLTPAIVP